MNIGDVCNVPWRHCLIWESAIFRGVFVHGVFYEVTENQLLNLCEQNEWQTCSWGSRRTRVKRVSSLNSPVRLAVRRALRQCLQPRERRHLTELKPTNPETRQPKFCRNVSPHNWVKFPKLLNTQNERVGQLEDRDCSRTSAPLQCHHDDNDGSESDSGIAPIERSKKPLPLFLL